MKNSKIAILLINWNQSDYTINCIKSLLKIDNVDFHIFLLDNNSNKKEQGILSKFLSNLDKQIFSFFQANKNLGFTGGNNFLLEHALLNKSITHIFYLNNDAIVPKNSLNNLLNTIIKDKNIGSIGPLILQGQNKNLIDSAGTKSINFLAQPILIDHNKKINKVYKEKEVPYITGCALLIPKTVIEEVGSFDNNFFAYFEDYDLGLRIKKHGYKNIFYPKSKIYHYGSVSTGNKSVNFYYFSFRNRIRFAKKHLNIFQFYFIFIPYLIFWKIIVKLLFANNKKNFIVGAFKGIIGAIKKKPTLPIK